MAMSLVSKLCLIVYGSFYFYFVFLFLVLYPAWSVSFLLFLANLSIDIYNCNVACIAFDSVPLRLSSSSCEYQFSVVLDACLIVLIYHYFLLLVSLLQFTLPADSSLVRMLLLYLVLCPLNKFQFFALIFLFLSTSTLCILLTTSAMVKPLCSGQKVWSSNLTCTTSPVSYTHLTLPTIYSV